ncbi:MAG: hypothetical protein EAZ92_00485 [Candidatus Kapaibacterium sp.]|nr:MAG: hypothetical protein EAZ92_00485 [Candidatus Kapabacteria bacterium]
MQQPSLPPLTVQERIATEAHTRRERAKALEREASEILAAAKAEVERMILGETNEKTQTLSYNLTLEDTP